MYDGNSKSRAKVLHVVNVQKRKGCSTPVKALVVALALAVVCCLVLLNLYLIERGKPEPPTTKPVEKSDNATSRQTAQEKLYGGSCWTTDCIHAASDLLDSLDPSADPCEDFFQYACGGWVKRNLRPEDASSWDQFAKLSRENDKYIKMLLKDKEIRAMFSKEEAVMKMLAYYTSCMDSDSIERAKGEPLERAIKELGSWSITDKNWNEKDWNLITNLVEIHKTHHTFPLFTMSVQIDLENSSQYTIALSQSSLRIIRGGNLRSNSTRDLRVVGAYKGFMRNLTRKLGAREDSETELMEILDFERELAKIYTPWSWKSSLSYKKMTLRELQEVTGGNMDWTHYVQLMLKEAPLQADESQEVTVLNIEYLKKLVKLLGVTPKRIINNYLMWAVVKTEFLSLGMDFRDIYKYFYLQAFNYWKDTDRNKFCIAGTSIHFGMPLSKVFLDGRRIGESTKRAAMEMIEDIRSSLISNLEQEDWLDEETKKTAIKKAEAVIENVGYPDYLMDVEYLTNEYKELKTHPKTYFDNAVSAKKFVHLKELARAGQLVDKSAWRNTPTDLNAFYSMQENKMTFPGAVLQPPFYNVLYPRAINYGAIGGIMAHEMTHGFDDDGRKFDSQGNRRDWWSNSTSKIFHEKSRCLVEQYSNYSLYGHQVNGERTLSENIADNGAVKVALEAYRKWVREHWEEPRLPGVMLTTEQVFFVSFAKNWCGNYTEDDVKRALQYKSVHAFRPVRVTGSLSNFPEFAKAFNCRLGSPMNPEKKCKVW